MKAIKKKLVKKINSKFKKLIIEYARKHAWNIGVDNYQMDINYASDDKNLGEDGIVAAEIKVNRRYLTCELTIFPHLEKVWKKEGNKSLNKIIAHEVAHLATAHIHELTLATYKDEGENLDAWETLTEMIGRLSVKVDKLENKN